MSYTNGSLLQKTLSRLLPNRLVLAGEIILLLLLGAAAVALHYKLRLPMQIPGRHGLFFMALIISGRLYSGMSAAATISTLGAATLQFFLYAGNGDPFLPLTYLMLGTVMDFVFGYVRKITGLLWLATLLSGMCWMFIPLVRILVQGMNVYFHHSFRSGLLYPFITHLAFGAAGAMLAFLIYSLLKRK